MANSDNGGALFGRLADSIGRAYGWKGLEAGSDSPSFVAGLLTRLQGPIARLHGIEEHKRPALINSARAT
jgi:hypothetical protein